MKTNTQAVEIGETLRKLRIDRGYASREELVKVKGLKGKLTREGLRKIEAGERIPRLENLHRLADALGASPQTKKQLERLVLEKNIERVTRRSGNVSVRFAIDGRLMDVERLPTKKKTEAFVRKVVEDLLEVTARLGMDSAEDKKYFRQHARQTLLRHLA